MKEISNIAFEIILQNDKSEKCIFELSWVHIQQLCDALQYFIYLENVLLSFHQVPLQYISSRNGNLYCRMYSHDINESDERNGSIFHPWMRATDKTTRNFFLNVLNNFSPWIWKKFYQFCFSPWNKSPHQLRMFQCFMATRKKTVKKKDLNEKAEVFVFPNI